MKCSPSFIAANLFYWPNVYFMVTRMGCSGSLNQSSGPRLAIQYMWLNTRSVAEKRFVPATRQRQTRPHFFPSPFSIFGER